MPRLSRKTLRSQAEPSNSMEIDSSDCEEYVSVSQAAKNMKRINMSQKGQRSKVNAEQIISDSDDSDEEPQPSTSRASTSQASQKKRKNNLPQSKRNKSLSQASTSAADTFMMEEMTASQISPNTSLTDQEFNHHIANVVKYILAADHSNIPIDKRHISKAVDCHNKHFKEIFKLAQQVLKDVFGYEMCELEDKNKNDAQNQGKIKYSPKFILVNTVNNEYLHQDIDEDKSARYVLLFLTLSHIFMSGDKCTDDSLKNFLKKLQILEENHVRHEQFGNVMDVITIDFVKKEYIKKVENKDDKTLELTWGVRANKELTPRAVMEFLSEIYNGKSIDSWPQEYQNMIRKEEEVNQRPNGVVNGVK